MQGYPINRRVKSTEEPLVLEKKNRKEMYIGKILAAKEGFRSQEEIRESNKEEGKGAGGCLRSF